MCCVSQPVLQRTVLFYTNCIKSRISYEHNVFWICDRPMCLTISLITAGKLPGCSVWALCPCLDLHTVKFSGFKHPCDAALFLASLADAQETSTVLEGDKTQSCIILRRNTQEWEGWLNPTQCLQKQLCRKEQMHSKIYLFPQTNKQQQQQQNTFGSIMLKSTAMTASAGHVLFVLISQMRWSALSLCCGINGAKGQLDPWQDLLWSHNMLVQQGLAVNSQKAA